MSILQLIVNESTRKLSNRSSNQVFVVNDANVDTIRFSIPAGFSDIDIDENASFRAMYIPPGIDKTVYAKTLTFVQNDGVYISYDWQVGPNVLVESGILTVSFCILKTGSEVQEWHTIPYTISVSNTIHTDDSDEADETITPTVSQRVAVLETMIQRVASGAPIVVASTSAMTDTNQIYVLSTDGNWYYHNGTAWVAGGEYGAVATDTTLTQSGIPADAKAVGDKVADLKSAVDQVLLTDDYSVTQYGTIYHAFGFVAGHTYKLTNGTNSTANAYTFSEASSSGEQIETIKTNWAANSTILFTATQNASAIKTYTGGAGTITIIDTSIGLPKMQNDVDGMQSEITDIKTNFTETGIEKTYGPTSDIFTFTESKYAANAGYSDSGQYDSWEFVASNNTSIYVSDAGESGRGLYYQLCVYPSGEFNDPNYARYRTSDNNLPTALNPLNITAGTKIIISTNKDNSTWSIVITEPVKTLSDNVMLSNTQIEQVSDNINTYYVTYTNGVLHIVGNGIDCNFSDADFNLSHGVFELQNLTYNNAVIFGTVNDYLGPVRVHGESIKGGKHGAELTDSVQIIADGKTLTSGDAVYAGQITIYVESTIATDEFKRYTVWAFNNGTMYTSTVLKTLKNLQLDYVFGCGIISSQDDVTLAWINKDVLTTNVLTGLNENTAIVTEGGTLISKRLSVNSAYGDHRVAFTVYSKRKKLYYYTCYGSDIAVPSDTVFASSAELCFM